MSIDARGVHRSGLRLRLSRGTLSAIDGSFSEPEEVIGGYAIFEAASREEAIELCRRFLLVHGDEWEVECELRELGGCSEGVKAAA